MVNIFFPNQKDLKATEMSPAAIQTSALQLDRASVLAFFEQDAPHGKLPQAPMAKPWTSASVSHNARNPPAARLPNGVGKVGYSGIVNLRQNKIWLGPLVAARGARKYQGPLRIEGRDLSPMDHYSGQAYDTVFGKGMGAKVLTKAKANPAGSAFLGKPNTVMGGHRLAGTRESSTRFPGNLSVDFQPKPAVDSKPKPSFWDSAGHRILVKRLGFNNDDCVGFAIMKNALGPGKHSVMFVSRLNEKHFKKRCMHPIFATRILEALRDKLG